MILECDSRPSYPGVFYGYSSACIRPPTVLGSAHSPKPFRGSASGRKATDAHADSHRGQRQGRIGLVRPLCCTLSMSADLEVQILRGPGHSDPREPQGDVGEGVSEGSGEQTDGRTNRNRIGGEAGVGERASDGEGLVARVRVANPAVVSGGE